MEDLILVHHLAVTFPIFKLKINQIKKVNHMQILDMYIFIQIMFIILNKHGKNFQVLNKIIILR